MLLIIYLCYKIINSENIFLATDFNECENNASECSENSYCNNTIGGYECLCNDGFEFGINDRCIGKTDIGRGLTLLA